MEDEVVQDVGEMVRSPIVIPGNTIQINKDEFGDEQDTLVFVLSFLVQN